MTASLKQNMVERLEVHGYGRSDALSPTAHRQPATVTDGQKQLIPYVGPIKVTFQNRMCFVGAFVLGDEVLLGAVPMEDMDLVIAGNRSP